jgi:hypothetical protein
MSNQIKLTIDLSDELVDKLLTVMALSSQKNSLQAAMPMLMGMGNPTPAPKGKAEKKPSMGFNMEKDNKK